MSYNRSYHSHFEGYVEREVVGKNGRRRIERVYAGEYYRHRLTDAQWKRMKRRYALLAAGSVAMLILSGLLPLNGNTVWYTGGALALCVLSLLWLMPALIGRLTAPRDMILRQYRARKSLIYTAMTGGLSFALASLSHLVYFALHLRGGGGILELVPALALIGGAVCLFILHGTEKNMEYSRLKNAASVPADGYDINLRSDKGD